MVAKFLTQRPGYRPCLAFWEAVAGGSIHHISYQSTASFADTITFIHFCEVQLGNAKTYPCIRGDHQGA